MGFFVRDSTVFVVSGVPGRFRKLPRSEHLPNAGLFSGDSWPRVLGSIAADCATLPLTCYGLLCLRVTPIADAAFCASVVSISSFFAFRIASPVLPPWSPTIAICSLKAMDAMNTAPTLHHAELRDLVCVYCVFESSCFRSVMFF